MSINRRFELTVLPVRISSYRTRFKSIVIRYYTRVIVIIIQEYKLFSIYSHNIQISGQIIGSILFLMYQKCEMFRANNTMNICNYPKNDRNSREKLLSSRYQESETTCVYER